MVHYSKKDVRRAGQTLVDPSATEEEKAKAEAVVNYWRNVHRRPLQLLLVELDDAVDASGECLIAGRIKKLDTIIDKMRRKNAIVNLSSMDDIAGCRVVVPDLDAQEALCDQLYGASWCDRGWSDRHDYVKTPKGSGYRGRHLLFRYDDPDHGYRLPVELQVRTELQHAWATAVEMYDEAAGDRLKFGEGSPEAEVFFRRAAVLMEQIEVRGKPDLASIHRLQDGEGGLLGALGILRVLVAAAQSVTILGEEPALSPDNYCLVDLDPAEQAIVLTELPPQDALRVYFTSEDNEENEGHNFVLLRGATMERLKILYPNYFGDISRFVNLFVRLIGVGLPFPE